MFSPTLHSFIASLHASARPAVLALTGGGASAAAWLLAVPGGSRWLLEVTVPYAQEALDAFLGCAPASYCSAETAVLLARRAKSRADWLQPGVATVGVGLTASLRSDSPKKGDHRVHLALVCDDQVLLRSLTLAKNLRSREEEEIVCARLLLDLIGRSCLSPPVELDCQLLSGEQIEETLCDAGPLANLVRGIVPSVCVEASGKMGCDMSRPALLLPGSFNPPHIGHWELAQVAARRTGFPVHFELSVTNVEKPTLDIAEIRRRLATFGSRGTVWLTRAPTFVQKARLFPQAVFVVGVDTAARIIQPRFYGESEHAMFAALQEIRQLGCRFLVGGRLAAGKFLSLGELPIPAEFADLFTGLSEEDFRQDISSTQLRSHGKT
jgi:nicotinamide mononucleotide (NMN) deamidase PncC